MFLFVGELLAAQSQFYQLESVRPTPALRLHPKNHLRGLASEFGDRRRSPPLKMAYVSNLSSSFFFCCFEVLSVVFGESKKKDERLGFDACCLLSWIFPICHLFLSRGLNYQFHPEFSLNTAAIST